MYISTAHHACKCIYIPMVGCTVVMIQQTTTASVYLGSMVIMIAGTVSHAVIHKIQIKEKNW